MQSYVINLDRSPDRLRYFQQQAASIGLAFERIAAVDGKQLSDDQIAEVRSTSFQFQPIDVGNIGLLRSHQMAWQRLLDSDQPHAAVFEDDVILAPSIARTLTAIDARQPEFDVIKLETTLRRVVCSKQSVALDSGDELKSLLTWHGGTAGYVISRRGAEHLLARKRETSDIIDLVMFHPRSRIAKGLDIRQLVPAACIQSQFMPRQDNPIFDSTLGKPTVGDHLLRYGIWIDARRFVRRQFESLRLRVLAKRSDNEQRFIPYVMSQQWRRAA